MISKKSFKEIFDSTKLYMEKTKFISGELGLPTLGDFTDFAAIILGALILDIEGSDVAYSTNKRSSLIMDYINTFSWGTDYPEGRCLVYLNGENLCPASTDELYDVLEKAYSKK